MTQMNRRPAPRRPGARTPARRGGASGWKRDVALLAIGGVIAAVLALVLQAHWPGGFPLAERDAGREEARVAEIHSAGPLRINEIMTGNRSTLFDEDGGSPDWLEIANVGSSAVNLAGYTIAKTESGTGAFTFPEMQLAPGECVVVLADSRLRADANDALHAPFRLSSSGDTLMLFSTSGAAIDTVNIPALSSDSSYNRVSEREWEISFEPTPGFLSAQESRQAMSDVSENSPVVVSEIVASNRSALADENREYHDYIELYNRSNETVELTGWYLSDDAEKHRKWRFPEISIGAGEYLVVYASGLNRRDDPAHLHTNFSLSIEGEQAVLSDAQGRLMDSVEFGLLKPDTAWALSADGSWGTAPPTPGSANP